MFETVIKIKIPYVRNAAADFTGFIRMKYGKQRS